MSSEKNTISIRQKFEKADIKKKKKRRKQGWGFKVLHNINENFGITLKNYKLKVVMNSQFMYQISDLIGTKSRQTHYSAYNYNP